VIAVLATATLVAGAGTAAAANAPVVTSLSPTSGPTGGGNTVTITGSNLNGGGTPTVTFGGTGATVNSSNATTLVVVAPAHVAGTVNVQVTTNGGSSATGGTGDDYT
jgi:hypothetical protein